MLTIVALYGRILPALCSVASLKCFPTCAEDELTKGARRMLQEREIPIWLVLAFQVYLDIHYTMPTTIGELALRFPKMIAV